MDIEGLIICLVVVAVFSFLSYIKGLVQQLEKVTTNLLMIVNNLAKELRELKAKQNPE